MGRSRYRVIGSLDIGGGAQVGTVTIDREAGLFSVRPLRRRREYVLPLSVVATMVCERIVRAELREKRAAKKSRRRR